jgi:hypothetical protein
MNSQCKNEEPEDRPDKALKVSAKLVGSAFVSARATVWRSYHFAPEWYRDALNEAHHGTDHDARRREIVFAVCVAESYLLEWVRDSVLNRDFLALDKYFPPGEKRPITMKWKKIIKQLKDDSLIPDIPNFGGTTWSNFNELVEFRNGLVHARASRPETDGLPEEKLPVPSKTILDELKVGWPTGVVYSLISELHDVVGTDPPDWLKHP